VGLTFAVIGRGYSIILAAAEHLGQVVSAPSHLGDCGCESQTPNSHISELINPMK
jgi:hypothetical protein